jgi:hypothetical protein
MLGGQGVADHVADVVGDQLGLLDLQRVHDGGDVLALVLLVVAAFRVGREAHAAQVGDDDGVILGQDLGDRRPHVAGVGEAVQQHHRRAGPADADVQGRAVDGDVAGLEAGGERFDRVGRGRGQQGREGQGRGGGGEGELAGHGQVLVWPGDPAVEEDLRLFRPDPICGSRRDLAKTLM